MAERVRTTLESGRSAPKPSKPSHKHDNESLNPSKKRKRDRDEKPHANNATSRPAHDAQKPSKHSHSAPSHFHKKHSRDHPNGGGGGGKNSGDKRSSSGPLAKRRDQLLAVRKSLPIWAHQDEIRAALRDARDVLVLVGETGSGKSTQVPQFLLAEPWLGGDGSKAMIAITQPRRVAAISLARRVAEEMGSPLGASSPASRVGYSVRFDVSTSPSTRVKFLTEGMLLQELLRDQWLKAYGCVVVDEVHERSVNVDLVLGFLRRIVCGDWKKHRNGRRLKVVVMSATADTQRLLRFFDEGFDEAEGKTAPALQEKASAANGTTTSKPSKDGKKKDKALPQKSTEARVNGSKDSETATKHHDSISACYIEGRMFPVKVNYLPDPTQDFVEAALKTIFQVHHKEPLPGDILVFLTGQDTVEALEKLVNEYAAGLGPELPKILTLPLFAALPQNLQQRVFQPAPRGTRKVILSTNIAETSVTVPGVRHVIDSGKSKIKQFRPQLNLDSLLVKPISQSASIQRKGRAGREAAGNCYRLYTEKDYLALQKDTTPEILRCDLSAALLTMKARGVHDVLNFPFLDPPPREALEKALLLLFQLGALTDTGDISATGLQMAKLPLTPPLARCIVEAASEARGGVAAHVIDVVAALSVENVFVNVATEEKREEAELARRELFRREGDHLTLLAAVRAFAAERADRRAWCDRRFVSLRAMQNVMDIRKQLRALCAQLGLLDPSSREAEADTGVSEAVASNVLLSLLRGFAPNTARLMPDGSYRTLVGNQTVQIHPSSVLFGKKVEAIVFSEFVFTNRSYARGVSAVRLDWVVEGLSGGRVE